MFEEDRPKFIPKQFLSLRNVPAYEKAVKESFNRCLYVYLCPRAIKKRINIDPVPLKPELPSGKDLKPYPTTCYLEYRGHKGPVMSISTNTSGHWIASEQYQFTSSQRNLAKEYHSNLMGFLSQQLSIQIDPSSLSQTGVGEVSSIAIHPGGDNVIVGSREGKLCWFDMDLSSQPHRILKCHPNVVTNVASIVPTLYLRGVLMMAQHIFFMAWCIRVYTRTPLLFH